MIDSGSRDCFSSRISLTFVVLLILGPKKTRAEAARGAPGLPRRYAWWIFAGLLLAVEVGDAVYGRTWQRF